MKCLNCEKETKNPKFCSSKCSAIYNNKKRRISSLCLNCEKEIKNYGSLAFCSRKCYWSYKKKALYRKIESGKVVSKKSLRTYLIEKNNSCFTCGISSWLEHKISLEIHHLDGNWKNTVLSNVILLCPNCHSQTDTFKGKNKGNGRDYRNKDG